MRELLEPVAVGTVRGDDDLDARVERGRLEQEVDALRAVEAARGEDEPVRGLRAVGERLRRVRQHLGDEARRALEPTGDVRRRREEARRLAEREAVELLHLPTERTLLGRGAELPQRGAVELVRLSELMDEPDALLVMADDVRGELRRDDDVDLPPVRLVEVEHPPEERLRQHARAGIPLERHRDEIGLVAACPQLRDELVREDLGAAPGERHLRAQNRDTHVVL